MIEQKKTKELRAQLKETENQFGAFETKVSKLSKEICPRMKLTGSKKCSGTCNGSAWSKDNASNLVCLADKYYMRDNANNADWCEDTCYFSV